MRTIYIAAFNLIIASVLILMGVLEGSLAHSALGGYLFGTVAMWGVHRLDERRTRR